MALENAQRADLGVDLIRNVCSVKRNACEAAAQAYPFTRAHAFRDIRQSTLCGREAKTSDRVQWLSTPVHCQFWSLPGVIGVLYPNIPCCLVTVYYIKYKIPYCLV
jgi:hypothetical protein